MVQLLDALVAAKIPFMIGGSFASSAWGFPRQTMDLDLEVLLDEASSTLLHEFTKLEYMGSLDQIHEAMQAKGEFRSFQLLHLDELFKVDFFLSDDHPYSEAAFERARPFSLTANRTYPFKSPEDILITKLRWFEVGRRVSDRQWNDIVQVLEVQKGHLDEAYLDQWCQEFQVFDLLEEARSLK